MTNHSNPCELEKVKETRLSSELDPTFGRVMDTFDNALQKMQEMQTDQISAQREIAEKRAALLSAFNEKGFGVIRLVLGLSFALLIASMFTGHLEQVVDIAKSAVPVLFAIIATYLGVDKFKS